MEDMESVESLFAFEIWSASIDKLADHRWIAGIDVGQIDAFLNSGQWDEISRAELLGERASALASYEQGDFDTALLKMGSLHRMCEHLGYRRAAHNKAVTGQKFINGRKAGTVGPIRKKISVLLKKDPEMKNPALWSEIIKSLPRGWTHFDNRQGKYLEGPSSDQGMIQQRFFTICGEERKKLIK